MPGPGERCRRLSRRAGVSSIMRRSPSPPRRGASRWRTGACRGLPGVPPRRPRGPGRTGSRKVSRRVRTSAFEAVDTHQSGRGPAPRRTRRCAPTQPPGAGGAHLASQPPSRPDDPGQRPPAKACLGTRIAAAWTCPRSRGGSPEQRVDGRPLPAARASPSAPVRSSGRRRHNRLGRPPRREPGDDDHSGRRRGAQPGVTGAGWGGEGLVALPAANRLACREWLPIGPWPGGPLAGHSRVGDNRPPGPRRTPSPGVAGAQAKREADGPPMFMTSHPPHG